VRPRVTLPIGCDGYSQQRRARCRCGGILRDDEKRVAAAHSIGVLHTDLKPSNVLVSRAPQSWQIRVIYFGSARLLEPERLRELAITQLDLTGPPGVGSRSISE
jgi:serine/threonine protein kinase